MSKNHYGPSNFGDPKIDNVSAAAISDEFSVFDMSGILLYAEFHQELLTTPVPDTSVPVTDAAEVGNAAVVRPWVLVRATNTFGEEEDAWMPLAEVTLTAIAHTANQPPPVISDAARCVATMVSIPNAIKAKLELISISANFVTIWGAPVERAPA